MTKKSEQAVECFNKGYNCAQAVLSTYASGLGMSQEQAFKVSCGFGSGMGRTGEVCGAVTGAFMVLGLKYGKVKMDDDQEKENTYRLVNLLKHKFIQRNKSIICRDLLGVDISTQAGRTSANEKGLFNDICPKMVKDAVEILEEII